VAISAGGRVIAFGPSRLGAGNLIDALMAGMPPRRSPNDDYSALPMYANLLKGMDDPAIPPWGSPLGLSSFVILCHHFAYFSFIFSKLV